MSHKYRFAIIAHFVLGFFFQTKDAISEPENSLTLTLFASGQKPGPLNIDTQKKCESALEKARSLKVQVEGPDKKVSDVSIGTLIGSFGLSEKSANTVEKKALDAIALWKQMDVFERQSFLERGRNSYAQNVLEDLANEIDIDYHKTDFHPISRESWLAKLKQKNPNFVSNNMYKIGSQNLRVEHLKKILELNKYSRFYTEIFPERAREWEILTAEVRAHLSAFEDAAAKLPKKMADITVLQMETYVKSLEKFAESSYRLRILREQLVSKFTTNYSIAVKAKNAALRALNSPGVAKNPDSSKWQKPNGGKVGVGLMVQALLEAETMGLDADLYRTYLDDRHLLSDSIPAATICAAFFSGSAEYVASARKPLEEKLALVLAAVNSQGGSVAPVSPAATATSGLRSK